MTSSESSCFALCKDDSGVELPIPCVVAKKEHGLCVKHGKMKTNGELRFRLNCDDGSAYIRTVTTQESRGWQNPHYHKSLKETYIVESGWIGYIEYKNREVESESFDEGSVFTTCPNVPHNIYMSEDAVIHTVKHGSDSSVEDSDWHNEGEGCAVLAETVASSLSKDWTFGTFPATKKQSQRYSEGYRHFDNLIWQVPAWATAIFAAVVAIIAILLSGDKLQPIFDTVSITRSGFSSFLLAFFGGFTFVLTYTLYRFRYHQAFLKDSKYKVISPQSLLQILLGIESGFLLFSSAFLVGINATISGIALTIIIGSILLYWENSLRKVLPHSVSSRSAMTSQKMS